jgi:cytochrome b
MKILVWDLPTRLFHWLLAAAFTVAWLSGGENGWLNIHVFAGYLMVGLLGFRLLWGFVGGRYARFSSFLFSPREGLAYLFQTLKGGAKRHLGHNPAGSWAIYLLLVLGLATGLSGLFTLGGQEGHGPLAAWVPYSMGHTFKEVHEFFVNAMLAVVLVHLGGVAVESWRHRENLARSMVSGQKEGEPSAAARSAHPLAMVLLLVAVAAGGVAYFRGDALIPREDAERDAGYKINRSIDPRETPERITETPYWRDKHHKIAQTVWRSAKVTSRANCVACHREAERGVFAGGKVPAPVTNEAPAGKTGATKAEKYHAPVAG